MSYSGKLAKIIIPIALAISLVACGGGDVTFGDSDAPSQAEVTSSIELSASTRQLFSDGSVPVIVSAIAKNSNNNAIDGADIVFSVNNDATIIPDAAEGSVYTAELTPGIAENRELIVKVTSGRISQSISIDVVGTIVTIDGPSAITFNNAVPFVIKLKDSAGNGISHEAVTITSNAGNTITTDSNYTTDANGEISFIVTAVQGGSDVLTAEVLGSSVNKAISISEDEFVITHTTEEMNINTSQLLNFFWNKNGIPQANKLIYLAATRGIFTNKTVTTDSLGKAVFEISSGTAGQTVITASTLDGLSTSLTREFVATTPAYLNTQADPTLITPNNSSTIISRIRDINDNPVKNKVISFRLDDTVNGILSASTAITDSLGRASVAYTAGDSTSAKDGVIITTFVQGYEGIVDEDVVRLTVGSDALRIVLGEDNLIGSLDVFYIKQFGVIVTDSAGNPVKEKKVDFTIIPTHYYKGIMQPSGDYWRPSYTDICESEDYDNDGKLDAGEDLNGNGLLEPTHDATVTGTGVTDDNGRIVIEVVYPKSRAQWSKQKITSSVIVNGTEFIEETRFILPVLAADVSDITVSPPNTRSPYGTFGTCTDKPDGIPPSAPVVAEIVDALTHAPILELVHDIWYSVTLDREIALSSDYTISSSKVTIEFGPNNTFKLNERNPASDDTGFYITLNIGGTSLPIFYRDDEAVLPPADTTAPVITVLGINPINVIQGSVGYVDAGASALDAVDGVVNATVISGLPLDTSNLGLQQVIYRAVDSAGNTSTAVRVVNIIPIP